MLNEISFELCKEQLSSRVSLRGGVRRDVRLRTGLKKILGMCQA